MLQARFKLAPFASLLLQRRHVLVLRLLLFLSLAALAPPVLLLLPVHDDGHAGGARLEAWMLRHTRVP